MCLCSELFPSESPSPEILLVDICHKCLVSSQSQEPT